MTYKTKAKLLNSIWTHTEIKPEEDPEVEGEIRKPFF